MKTRTIGIVIVVVVIVVAAAIAVVSRGSSGDASASAADVEVLPASGFALADYAGKPLVINFFGRKCPPCNIEAPDLAQFAREHPEAQFLAVDTNDGESDAVAFMAEHGLEFPVIVEDGSIGGEYGIQYIPTTLFFDAQGQLKHRIDGAATPEQFAAGLAKAQ